MNEKHQPESTKPTNHRLQFGVKYLLAAPVVLALLLATDSHLELPFGSSSLAFALLAGITYWIRSISKTNTVLIGWGIAVLVIICLTLSVIGPRTGLRAEARRTMCAANLKNIGFALYNYHDTFGSFPPAYVADENGRPMHSWRVLILPFINQQALYNRYDFNEPWNGPNNSRLADIPCEVFSCPAESGKRPGITSYLAVVGANTIWPGAESTKLTDISDVPDDTLLVVEVADSGIHWMEPRDLHVVQMAPTINPAAGQGVSSSHAHVANVLFADGFTYSLSDGISPQDLRAMLTRSGGEPVDIKDVMNALAD